MTTIATPNTARVRRQPLPGEVNITNNQTARDALAAFQAQKAREADGAKAKRERTAEGGSESILRDALGDGNVLVIRGVAALKRSSPRKTVKVDMELLKTAFPEAAAACITEVAYDFLT